MQAGEGNAFPCCCATPPDPHMVERKERDIHRDSCWFNALLVNLPLGPLSGISCKQDAGRMNLWSALAEFLGSFTSRYSGTPLYRSSITLIGMYNARGWLPSSLLLGLFWHL